MFLPKSFALFAPIMPEIGTAVSTTATFFSHVCTFFAVRFQVSAFSFIVYNQSFVQLNYIEFNTVDFIIILNL
ncbi:MAG: hypothetical protein DWQ04_07990 [Chloroflexi bacterium]|nr:MAG: hypothetical protein DWQ04_07990 [Chloroflexota bacterium]